jgi:hypothetical protein
LDPGRHRVLLRRHDVRERQQRRLNELSNDQIGRIATALRSDTWCAGQDDSPAKTGSVEMDAWRSTDDTVSFLIDRFALPYATGTLTPVARGVDGADPAARSHLAFSAGWPAGMSSATTLKQVLDAR